MIVESFLSLMSLEDGGVLYGCINIVVILFGGTLPTIDFFYKALRGRIVPQYYHVLLYIFYCITTLIHVKLSLDFIQGIKTSNRHKIRCYQYAMIVATIVLIVRFYERLLTLEFLRDTTFDQCFSIIFFIGIVIAQAYFFLLVQSIYEKFEAENAVAQARAEIETTRVPSNPNRINPNMRTSHTF